MNSSVASRWSSRCALHYNSTGTGGNMAPRQVRRSLTGSTIFAKLQSVELYIEACCLPQSLSMCAAPYESTIMRQRLLVPGCVSQQTAWLEVCQSGIPERTGHPENWVHEAQVTTWPLQGSVTILRQPPEYITGSPQTQAPIQPNHKSNIMWSPSTVTANCIAFQT
jgi:hypothetical protein